MKLLKSDPIGLALFTFTLGAFLVLLISSCTPLGRAQAITSGLDVGICVARNLDKPIEIAIAECAKDNISPEDVRRMFDEQTLAANRLAAKQMAAKGCLPVPAPVPAPDAGPDAARK